MSREFISCSTSSRVRRQARQVWLATHLLGFWAVSIAPPNQETERPHMTYLLATSCTPCLGNEHIQDVHFIPHGGWYMYIQTSQCFALRWMHTYVYSGSNQLRMAQTSSNDTVIANSGFRGLKHFTFQSGLYNYCVQTHSFFCTLRVDAVGPCALLC